MLVDAQLKSPDAAMAAILAIIGGGNSEPGRIGKGLYLSTHWNFDAMLPGKWDEWADVGSYDSPNYVSAYGVCDSPEQFMQKVGAAIEADPADYVVSFVRLRKDEQSEEGGWRWHKWGEYIGEQKPQCEYLFDEPVIEEVYTYHIYKRVG